jgi:hypothetical protein
VIDVVPSKSVMTRSVKVVRLVSRHMQAAAGRCSTNGFSRFVARDLPQPR